jgi:hypothetical protein
MGTSVWLAVLSSWLAVVVSGQATLEWSAIPVPTGHDMVKHFLALRGSLDLNVYTTVVLLRVKTLGKDF